MYLKKGDEVIVIAGNDKGKTGVVNEILPNNKIIVSGIGISKKHQKENGLVNAGIIEIERPIDASNVSLFDKSNKQPSRIKKVINKDGSKVRVLIKSNKEV